MSAPLLDFFRQRGIALMSLEGGAMTPLRFSDRTTEHLATRRGCGLFDFSFMACVEIGGRGSLAFLQHLQTRNLSQLPPGRLAYTLMLRPDGTVLNDATVWCLDPQRYWFFSGRAGDLDHVRAAARGQVVSIDDRSHGHAVLAVQGSRSWQVLSRCLSGLPAVLPYYSFCNARFGDSACKVAHISYSGETGYELIVDGECGSSLWRAVLAAGTDCGLVECGFEATDSLRIEAGHILFSRELVSPVTPCELGFARLLDFHREPATGIGALRARRWQAPRQHLVGFLIDEDSALPVSTTGGESARPVVGTARPTSVCHSPIFGRLLGLGFVSPADRYPGTRVKLVGGGRARVARLPFYDPGRVLARHAP